MCDSSISESCLGDFSQYCPFNNQPRLPGDRKSTIRKRIALFSKADSQHHLYSVSQPILQQSHVSREDIEATPKSYGGGISSKVPPDDLSVLDGCVSRNRVLFSPTPSEGTACIQLGRMKSTGTWPDLIACHESRGSSPQMTPRVSSSNASKRSQNYFQYSVSVQFENVKPDGESSQGSSVHSSDKSYTSENDTSEAVIQGRLHPVSSIPGKLNSSNVRPFLKVNHLKHSHSLHSEKTQPCLLNVPVVRTNSLDGQKGTVCSIDSSHAFCLQKQHGKADYFSDVPSTCGSQRSLSSSICTFQESSSYVKGVDGQVFKDRMQTVQKWFSESNDQQRNMMLLNLLDQCNCAQIHLLSLHMEPILHNLCPLNCQDLLSWLPSNLAFCILSFLDPVSLCQASRVSRMWYHMASDYRLWMRFCRLNTWQLSQIGEKKQRSLYVSAEGRVMWKAMFSERFRIRRNWLKGFCNVRTFEGHTQGISCIQFDDTRIVSGSWDKTIKVWNRRTNTAWAALTLAGHSGTVRCLHLHDNRLVSGSSDRTIKVWDLATDNINWVGATCRTTMVGHMHTVRCLQADDEKVISGSYDNTLKVWDLGTGVCSLTLRGHDDAVLCLHFHGKKLVSGSKDTTIKVWSLPDGHCKLTLHGHQAAVTCVQFDDTRIISGALDRLIKIWSLESGQCVRTIDWIRSEGHTGVIRHLQADGWKIVSAADDKTLKVWSVITGDRLLTLKSHTDGVTCLQFNDEVIVSGSYDKTVKLWDFSVC